MKKALVLAGQVSQKKLIEELKSMGYFTILADYYPNPVAKTAADDFYQESTLDLEAIRNIAINEKVDLIITCCTDQALDTVAKISEELGLPCYVNAEIGHSVTNKEYMKRKFNEFSIPTAKHQVVHNLEDAKDVVYPSMVKPADCNSSKGVEKVYNKEELDIALKEALKLSRTHTAIVEQFIDGKEITTDFFITNGKSELICYSNNDSVLDDKSFVINKTIYPANVSENVVNKVREVGQKIADAFELKNCPMLVQMMVKDEDVYVLEFSARTGGCIKFHLIERASGVDVIKHTIEVSEGKTASVSPKFSNKVIADEYIYCHPGIFTSIEGFEECKKEGLIEEYFVLVNPGTEFTGVKTNSDRVIAFTIIADNYDEFLSMLKMISERIKVLDQFGNNMIRFDLLLEDRK